jgi:GxxExxY protein
MKVVRPNLTSSERLHERLAAARLAVPDQWHFLTEAVIEGAEEVHATLGPGLSRESYAAALRHELALRGLAVEAGREIERWYKGVELPRQRLELVVNGLVAVELASADTDVQLGLARLGAQLFAADAPIGLLINFDAGLLRNGVYRRLNAEATAARALPPASEAIETDPLRTLRA